MKNWLMGALMLSAVPMVAAAQTCAFEPEILAAADRILEIRPQMGRLRGAEYGADAVYFKLLYEGLSTEEGLALIERVSSELRPPPRRLDDMLAAYAITRLGAEDGLAIVGPTALAAFSELGLDGQRALILSDGGVRFFELRAQVLAGEALAARILDTRFFDSTIASAILDQSDVFLLEFARMAEREGALAMAEYVLAARKDLTDYDGFVARHADGPDYPGKGYNLPFLLLKDRARAEPRLPRVEAMVSRVRTY